MLNDDVYDSQGHRICGHRYPDDDYIYHKVDSPICTIPLKEGETRCKRHSILPEERKLTTAIIVNKRVIPAKLKPYYDSHISSDAPASILPELAIMRSLRDVIMAAKLDPEDEGELTGRDLDMLIASNESVRKMVETLIHVEYAKHVAISKQTIDDLISRTISTAKRTIKDQAELREFLLELGEELKSVTLPQSMDWREE